MGVVFQKDSVIIKKTTQCNYTLL